MIAAEARHVAGAIAITATVAAGLASLVYACVKNWRGGGH